MAIKVSDELKLKAEKINSILFREYPDVKSALNFKSAFELLIATILSAQCTDERVNAVCKNLFEKYKSVNDFVLVSNEELEKDIFSTGFYRQKAKSIKECCKILLEKYNSEVPNDFVLLTELPGVGRKTASVIMGNAFGVPAVAVDTHVKRISNLLGLIDNQDPTKIESRIKELLLPKYWTKFSHLIATHGRNICFARKPECKKCVVSDYCEYFCTKL